tara:strand:- start:9250 stop:9798 length:549 start_codon:yes stop_codon:yes gene_type:complete
MVHIESIGWQWWDERAQRPGDYSKSHLMEVDRHGKDVTGKTLCGVSLPEEYIDMGSDIGGRACKKCERIAKAKGLDYDEPPECVQHEKLKRDVASTRQKWIDEFNKRISKFMKTHRLTLDDIKNLHAAALSSNHAAAFKMPYFREYARILGDYQDTIVSLDTLAKFPGTFLHNNCPRYGHGK